jgi:Nuclease-related domain
MIFRAKPRAGAFAEERYRRGLRSWRARIRPSAAAIFGPFIVAGIVVFFLDGHYLSWIAGMATGAFGGAWIAVRESPPSYIENWRDGAEGERKAEKALRPLERAGWHVFHDIQNGHGNYDHIAVGSAGVYLLDSKNLRGIVGITDGVPHLQRRLDPEDNKPWQSIPQRARAAAAGLKEDIERRTGHRIWVQAVVVFWSEFPEAFVEDDKCVFIEGSRLCAWLQSRPDRLSEVDVEGIAAGVESIATGPADHAAAASSGLVPA